MTNEDLSRAVHSISISPMLYASALSITAPRADAVIEEAVAISEIGIFLVGIKPTFAVAMSMGS